MHLISLNVGLPRDVVWKGKTVTTGIFKEPVHERLMLRTLNLEGDGQADLTVHGGKDKAVYAYPSEHYDFWRRELPDMELPWGMFGENLTTAGLLEHFVCIGDQIRIGSAVLMVTEPRLPCYKLGVKFGRADIVKRFLASRLTGFYFSVVQEGEVGAGDTIEQISQDEHQVSVADITRLYTRKEDNEELLALLTRAMSVQALPDSWRNYFQKQIS